MSCDIIVCTESPKKLPKKNKSETTKACTARSQDIRLVQKSQLISYEKLEF